MSECCYSVHVDVFLSVLLLLSEWFCCCFYVFVIHDVFFIILWIFVLLCMLYYSLYVFVISWMFWVLFLSCYSLLCFVIRRIVLLFYVCFILVSFYFYLNGFVILMFMLFWCHLVYVFPFVSWLLRVAKLWIVVEAGRNIVALGATAFCFSYVSIFTVTTWWTWDIYR
jgi:hypothetical protein